MNMKSILCIALTGVLIILSGCKRDEKPVATATSGTAVEKPKPAAVSKPGIDIGSMMPAYAATMLDGTKFDLESRRGKVVLLNVWATWCAPCRHEIPELEKLHRKYASRGFEVIGVSVDEGEAEPVKQFMLEQKTTYPQVHDPEGRLANMLQTYVLPTSVLLDRDGRIVWKKYELIPPDDASLAAAIEKAAGAS